jgi:dihydropteroate synthase
MNANAEGTTESFDLALPGGRRWRVGLRPAILGVLNVTPDSFSDGGLHLDSGRAVEAGLQLLADGADAVDVGGESTRPGARPVASEEQRRRVIPVLRGLRRQTQAPLSVDTQDPEVGWAALDDGADVINDVSACRDPAWVPLLRSTSAVVVLMHMRGTPQDMQARTEYPRGVVTEIVEFLGERLAYLERAGVSRGRCIVDPGIGFAKTAEQNIEILAGLPRLGELGRPILVGASRKFFLGKLLCRLEGVGGADRGREPRDRDIGTVAANVVAVLRGASILRVHNVAYTRDLADVLEAVQEVSRRGALAVSGVDADPAAAPGG